MTKIIKFYEDINVKGSLTLNDGTQGTGKILISDSGGTATWASQSSLENIVFVSKNGNDSTGLPERIDKPFLTLSAATAAATGLTPSVTNRILIKVSPGTYNEQLALANYVDWDLGNAIIDLQSNDSESTISDKGVNCDSIIYGNAQILRTTSGVVGGCIYLGPASSNLKIHADYMYSSIGGTIQCDVGSTLFARVNTKILCTSTAGTQTISCNSGTMTIYGLIESSVSGVANIGGTQHIYGDIIVSGSTGARCSGNGHQNIYGNITSPSVALLSNLSSGNLGSQVLFGNILQGSATVTTGKQTIFGNIYSGTAACSSGIQTINGEISGSTSTGAVCGTNGKQTINGNIFTTTAYGAECSAGNQNINGKITSTGNYGAYSSGGIQNIIGEITSNALSAAFCDGGTQRIKGRIVTTAPNTDAYDASSGGGISILDNCTLIATGTGNTVTAASTVKVYGGCQGNLAVGAGVTQEVGTITIDANVI